MPKQGARARSMRGDKTWDWRTCCDSFMTFLCCTPEWHDIVNCNFFLDGEWIPVLLGLCCMASPWLIIILVLWLTASDDHDCHSYEPDNHHPNLYPYFVACQAACSEEYQCCNVEVSQGMNGKPSCLQACYESLIRLDEELDVSESVCLDSCARTQCKYTVHGGVQIDMCGYVPGGSCYSLGVIDDTCYSQVCADVPGNQDYCESNPAPYDCAAADGVDEFSCVTGCKVAQELKDSF